MRAWLTVAGLGLAMASCGDGGQGGHGGGSGGQAPGSGGTTGQGGSQTGGAPGTGGVAGTGGARTDAAPGSGGAAGTGGARTDAAPGKEHSARIRMDFIRQNVENYRMAERKAQALAADAELAKLQAVLWDREPGMAKLLAQGDPSAILGASADHEKVNGAALQIGKLDQLVNRRLLGL